MSTSWMNIDQGFPTFTGQETPQQQIQAMHSYLYQLREGLQYSLQNLTARNFNAKAWESIQDGQAQAVAEDLEKLQRQITRASNELSQVSARVTEMEELPQEIELVWAGLEEVAQRAEMLEQRVRDIVSDSALAVWPVGSLYWSANSTSPEVLFGGGWEPVKDLFPLAAGDIYPAGSSGGEAEHTMTLEEMPDHRHGITYAENTGTINITGVAVGNQGSHVLETGNAGGGAAHNNMPPYKAFYCWVRVA